MALLYSFFRARRTPEAPGTHQMPLWSYRPQSDREAGDAVVSNFALHWFPAKVSKAAMAWSYSFWLGTISAALFVCWLTKIAIRSWNERRPSPSVNSATDRSR